MIQVENVFTTLHGDRARVARRKFEVEEGDLLTILNIFLAFEKSGRSKAWCGAHFLRFKALKRAAELREQLFKVLNRFGVELTSTLGESLRMGYFSVANVSGSCFAFESLGAGFDPFFLSTWLENL